MQHRDFSLPTARLNSGDCRLTQMRSLWHFAIIFTALAAVGCRSSNSFEYSYQTAARSKLSASIKGHPDAHLLTSVTNLPVAVRQLLGPIADSGEAFEPGCDGSAGVPHRRFLAGTKIGQVYTVAIERGGIAHFWDKTEFVLDENDKVVSAKRLNN